MGKLRCSTLHQSRGFNSESRTAADKYESISAFNFSSGVLDCCASLLFFKILSSDFFLAGGGLVSALSVVEVAVVELLSVAYCKPSRDILPLIAVTLSLGSYIFSFESWIKKRCSV